MAGSPLCAHGLACAPPAALPLALLLLSPPRSQLPSSLRGQRRHHLLPHQETQGARCPPALRCLGLHMVLFFSPRPHHPAHPPSYSHLLVTRPSKSRALEVFVVETAQRSTHIAMIVRLFSSNIHLLYTLLDTLVHASLPPRSFINPPRVPLLHHLPTGPPQMP